MEYIKLISLFTSASLVIIGALVWLLKKVAVKWIDSTFTIKERELDHRLKMIEQKEGLVFDREHADQREAIRNVHGKLIAYATKVKYVVVGVEGIGMLIQRLKESALLLPELHNAIGVAELYLPDPICSKMSELGKKLNDFERAQIKFYELVNGNALTEKQKVEVTAIISSALGEFSRAGDALVTEFKKLTRTKMVVQGRPT